MTRSEKNSVLKYVPFEDLPAADPIWSVSYETRNHGFMVFDTLYGEAGTEQGFAPKPQMVAGHTIENDGRTWTGYLGNGAPPFRDQGMSRFRIFRVLTESRQVSAVCAYLAVWGNHLAENTRHRRRFPDPRLDFIYP